MPLVSNMSYSCAFMPHHLSFAPFSAVCPRTSPRGRGSGFWHLGTMNFWTRNYARAKVQTLKRYV